MTLQSSGQINFSDIQTEFGDTGELRLPTYYNEYPGIPDEGEISASDFYGVQDIEIIDSSDRVWGGSGASGVGFYTRDVAVSPSVDGGEIYRRRQQEGSSVDGSWASVEPTTPTDFQMRITRNSFSNSGGTAGNYIQRDGVDISYGVWYTIPISTATLGAMATGVTAFTIGDRADLDVTVEIRQVGDTEILFSANYDLTCFGYF